MNRDKPQTMFRLSPQAYEELEHKLPQMVVQRDTTDLQAGMQLGIQMVLKMLRDGYVVSS